MSMNIVRAVLVLACVLATVSSQAKPPADDAMVRADFTDSTVAGLGATKRVAITNVIVSFQASVGTTKGAGSGMFADKSSSTSLMALPDMDAALQDAIVAQAYSELKTNLIAAGFEVVPEAEVAADANYKAIIAKVGFANHSRSTNELGDAILVSPANLTPYMPYTAEGGLFEAGAKSYLGWGSGWGKPATPGGFSLMKAGTFYQLPGMEVALAKSLNAHVVKAFYVVNIGRTTAAHSRTLGAHQSTTAEANAFAQLGLMPDQTRIAFRAPNGNAKWQKVSMTKSAPAKDGDVVVHLAEPMLGSTDFFDVNGDGGHERGGWLLATGDFKFTYTASINDAAAYQAEVQTMISTATRSMVALVKP
jgi:hypothetical protein